MMPEKPPESLSDLVRQLTGALKDGFDRATEELKQRERGDDTSEFVRRLKTIITEKDAELVEWRKTAEVLQVRLTDLQAELRAERVRNGNDAEEMDRLRGERDDFAEEVRRLTEHGRLPERLAIAQQTCQEQATEIHRLDEDNVNLVRQRDDLWERKERLEDMVGKLNEELRHVVTRERFEEVLDERDRARSECGALQGGNAQLKSQIDNQVSTVRDARTLADELRVELSRVRERVMELEQGNQLAAVTIGEKDTALEGTRAMLAMANERHEEMERELRHERTVANRCNDFLQARDAEIAELRALVQTLGADLQARKSGDEPRIDVFDKLENLRERAESLEQRMLDIEGHTHGNAINATGRTGFPVVNRG